MAAEQLAARPTVNGTQPSTIIQKGSVPGAVPTASERPSAPVTCAASAIPTISSTNRNTAHTSRDAPAEIRPTASSPAAADR